MTSALIRIVPRPTQEKINDKVRSWFVPESLAMASVLDDNAMVAGDFRIDPAGHVRFALFVNEDTGPQRVGRVVQRLCEIETYRAMSMLGFSRARGLTPTISAMDASLSEMMGEMTRGHVLGGADADTAPDDLGRAGGNGGAIGVPVWSHRRL